VANSVQLRLRVEQMPGDGLRQRHAVEGRGAAADLVHQHQTRSVALCRMAAASVISTMKVERPEARSSEAPMRVWIASIGPSRAAPAGTEAAAVRQQHDQRHLAHVGRFAAHVRAGDQQHAACVMHQRSRWR
jgi:hypothetical protein